jgi:hypothetical protein
MTYTIWGGSTNTTVGNAFNMAAGDQLQTIAGSLLATSGGNGINATGSAWIEVGGTVGGLNNGIYVGTASAADNAYIVVEKTGNVFSGASTQGIQVFGAGNHTILNAGSIQSINSVGYGIITSGAGQIVNQYGGYISAGRGIVEADSVAADVASFVNFGYVVGTATAFRGSGSAREVIDNSGVMVGAIEMNSNASDLVYNRGTMDATGASGTGFYLNDSVLNNAGLMYQSVASASAVNMIAFGHHAGDYFSNSGVVAEIHAAPGSRAVSFGNGAGDILSTESAGVIYGDVSFGTGAGDAVVNNGAIYGNVILGSGAGDAYYGQHGHLNGNVVCGAGGDIVYSGSGYETATAGLGNDSFYSASGGGLVIAETVAAQQANALDVVNNFQVATGELGKGTYLHLDAALSSTTLFMSDGNGGTWIAMGLGGGAYSYLDVVGVGVSTVHAQTYFA